MSTCGALHTAKRVEVECHLVRGGGREGESVEGWWVGMGGG